MQTREPSLPSSRTHKYVQTLSHTHTRARAHEAKLSFPADSLGFRDDVRDLGGEQRDKNEAEADE